MDGSDTETEELWDPLDLKEADQKFLKKCIISKKNDLKIFFQVSDN